jgi:hypothetical protein
MTKYCNTLTEAFKIQDEMALQEPEKSDNIQISITDGDLPGVCSRFDLGFWVVTNEQIEKDFDYEKFKLQL